MADPSTEAPLLRPRGFLPLLRWAYQSWATRSLAVGAVATFIDVAVLLLLVTVAHAPNVVGAMAGVMVGGAFTFVANRHFAFRDHTPNLAPQAMKFVLATGAAMVVHANFIYFLCDRMGLHVVVGKVIADIAVFSVGQLLVLRYFVFPKAKGLPDPVGALLPGELPAGGPEAAGGR
jgi:putative flippase GtrA